MILPDIEANFGFRTDKRGSFNLCSAYTYSIPEFGIDSKLIETNPK